MNTDDLTRALRDATDDIEPRRSFTTDVVRGGRRRQFRRRMAVTGTLAVVMAAGVVVSVAPWAPTPPAITAAAPNPMLTAATRGDLAGDADLLSDAKAAFTKGMAAAPGADQPGNALIGEPRVYWAGTTPAGKVAIVVQQRESEKGNMTDVDGTVVDLSTVQRIVIGLVAGDQATDRATLVNSAWSSNLGGSGAERLAFLFGPSDRYSIAFSGGPPLHVSPEWKIGDDGRGIREWMAMKDLDGISFHEFPRSVRGADVRVVRAKDPATAGYPGALITLPASLYAEGFDRQSKPIPVRTMDWPQDQPLRAGGAKAAALTDALDVGSELQAAGYGDPLARVGVTGFEVIADLPDGGSVVGIEYVPNDTGSRLYLGYRDAAGKVTKWAYGGPLNAAEPLPVNVRLENGQGTLVAARGAVLRYRVDGDWIDAGKDAALLPANATQVEVTRDGTPPLFVTL
ncbi:hypothetical protein [Actinokineospora xionganensis]|uniref:Uncharacterized protein n=1 Tax=Actinokineospora xionganensis TaxID=2684470 RepID=A0ABR7L8J4_9PSEU|nr:hypothetical protein [Actinokineospora xionganensis]MBC6449026.1 hypothetical protein [Actinokineospora xionganensis]